MSQELFTSERITVRVAANSASKVMITDNFAGSSITLNREAFEVMCRHMAQELKAKEAKIAV